jgi:hypothetical protein
MIKIRDVIKSKTGLLYYWKDSTNGETMFYRIDKDIATNPNKEQIINQMYETVTNQLMKRRTKHER